MRNSGSPARTLSPMRWLISVTTPATGVPTAMFSVLLSTIPAPATEAA